MVTKVTLVIYVTLVTIVTLVTVAGLYVRRRKVITPPPHVLHQNHVTSRHFGKGLAVLRCCHDNL